MILKLFILLQVNEAKNYILSSLVNNLIPLYSSNILVEEKCECSPPVLWTP